MNEPLPSVNKNSVVAGGERLYLDLRYSKGVFP